MNSLLVSKEKVEVTKMGKSKTEGDKYGSKKKKKKGGDVNGKCHAQVSAKE